LDSLSPSSGSPQQRLPTPWDYCWPQPESLPHLAHPSMAPLSERSH
jgi:hypothetical protein